MMAAEIFLLATNWAALILSDAFSHEKISADHWRYILLRNVSSEGD